MWLGQRQSPNLPHLFQLSPPALPIPPVLLQCLYEANEPYPVHILPAEVDTEGLSFHSFAGR